MALTLADALNKHSELGIDELNNLVPEVVAATLGREDVVPGSTIGDWTVVETDEGHRGFRAEIPSPLAQLSQVIEVLQIEPGYLSIAISHLGSDEADSISSGTIDFRTALEAVADNAATAKDSPASVQDRATADNQEDYSEAASDDEALLQQIPEGLDDVDEETFEQLEQLSLLMALFLLNIDLFNFLAGEPVADHRQLMEEINRDFHNAMLGESDPDDEGMVE